MTGSAALMLQVALVLAIPIVVAELGWAGLRRIAPEGYFKIPLLTGSAKLLGIAAGVLAVASHYDRTYFDLHFLFLPNGPWDITVGRFLAERVNPLAYGLAPVTGMLRGGEGAATFGLGAGVLLAALVLAAPFAFWPRRSGLRGVATSLLMVVLSGYLAIYAICLLMWTLHLLNFWTFAVMLVVLQYYRLRA